MKKSSIFQNNLVVFLLAFLACLLWGSAFPCVKIGYELFQIVGDTKNSMLYAGIRFVIAGGMLLLVCSVKEKTLIRPKTKHGWFSIMILIVTQMVGEYVFYYIGLYNTAGVKASVINGAGSFLSILMACFLFRRESFTPVKFLGCVLGFAGVILVNSGGQFDFQISLMGEGFLLISALFSALSNNLMKGFSRNENPVMLTAWFLLLGGVLLAVTGLLLGGSLHPVSPLAFVILFYLAFISATAFSIMGILYRYNEMSKIASYRTLTPVLGFTLSALILGEGELLRFETIFSLVLVALGIFLINRFGEKGHKKTEKSA